LTFNYLSKSPRTLAISASIVNRIYTDSAQQVMLLPPVEQQGGQRFKMSA